MTWTFTPALPSDTVRVVFTMTDGCIDLDYDGVYLCDRNEFIRFNLVGVLKKKCSYEVVSPKAVLRWRYSV